MDRSILEAQLAELPLYTYEFLDPEKLEFSQRIRWICENECPMYGQSWACPPAVGSVEECHAQCRRFNRCLMVSTITEVRDIADIDETLSTRPDHEAFTNQVGDLLRAQGIELEQYLGMMGMDMNGFRMTTRPSAERQLRINLMLEAIVAAEQFEVTDEELEAEMQRMAEIVTMDESEMTRIVL